MRFCSITHFRRQRQKEKEENNRAHQTDPPRRHPQSQAGPPPQAPRRQAPDQVLPRRPRWPPPERSPFLPGPEARTPTPEGHLLRTRAAPAPLRGRRRGVGRTLGQWRQLLGQVLRR